MTNHQNTDIEQEQLNQARQAFWLSALMRSADIEKTHQELRQSIIETNQSLQKYLDDTQKEAISKSLSLTTDIPEQEKEELLKEAHEMFLEINKSIGMDEQGSKARLEQELIELENIKNQVITTRKQHKTSFFIASIIVLIITIGVYVLR